MPPVRFHPRRICEQAADTQKFGDGQGAADFQPFHGFLHGHGVPEGNPSLPHDAGKSGSGLFLKCIDLPEVSHGL